jgi:hypothetical protein
MAQSLIDVPTHPLMQRGFGSGGKKKTLDDLARGIYLNIGRNTKYETFRKTYRNDRVAFVYDCVPKLKDTFAPYQEEVFAKYDMGVRRQAVRGPHGLGKTLMAALLVHHTLLAFEEDATVPTLASVWRQLEKFLWPEIHKACRLLDWQKIGREPYTRDELMLTSIRTNDGQSEAFAVSAGEASAIEGAHASILFYIFDESKSIDNCMWDAAEGAFSTEGAVTTSNTGVGECYWFAISTPGSPAGRFYEIHSHKEGLDDWDVTHVTIEEAIAAGRVGYEWVEKRKKQWGANSAVYKNRVLGQFATDGNEGVIPLDWVEMAFDRWKEWDEGGRLGEGLGLRKLGVDTARMGDDKTCFAERIGDRIERLHTYGKRTVPVTAGLLKPLAKQSAAVNIEMDSGLGAAVYDMLNQEIDWLNPSMNLIQVYMGAGTLWTDSTHVFRFNCVRSAAWWNMRQLLDPDNGHEIALFPSDILMGDLTAPRWETKYIHGWLTICVEPKDIIKTAARLGRSTDEGDAVVLAYWDQESGGGGVVF